MPSPCPACGTDIPVADINVQMDTAICRACGHATAYSAIVHAPVLSVHTAPPDGCDVQNDGVRWRAVATTRSWVCIPLLFFAVLWNGLLLAFVGGIILGRNPWMLVFLSLHIAAGAVVLWAALCNAVGTTEVIIAGDAISTSLGIGPARITRRRPLREIRGIRRVDHSLGRGVWGRGSGTQTVLELEGPKPLKFGSLLSDERRQFMHAAIAAELARRRGKAEGRTT